MLNDREKTESKRAVERMMANITPNEKIAAQEKAFDRITKEPFTMKEQIEYWTAIKEFNCFI